LSKPSSFPAEGRAGSVKLVGRSCRLDDFLGGFLRNLFRSLLLLSTFFEDVTLFEDRSRCGGDEGSRCGCDGECEGEEESKDEGKAKHVR